MLVWGRFAADLAQLPKQRGAERAMGNHNHVSSKISCVLAASITLRKQGSGGEAGHSLVALAVMIVGPMRFRADDSVIKQAKPQHCTSKKAFLAADEEALRVLLLAEGS